MIIVSRRTKFTSDGRKACSWRDCQEPRDQTGQRYCRTHRNEYARLWRAGLAGAGKVDMRVTPEEQAAVLAARAGAGAGGRHRAG